MKLYLDSLSSQSWFITSDISTSMCNYRNSLTRLSSMSCGAVSWRISGCFRQHNDHYMYERIQQTSAHNGIISPPPLTTQVHVQQDTTTDLHSPHPQLHVHGGLISAEYL